jgi:hypothetical protein
MQGSGDAQHGGRPRASCVRMRGVAALALVLLAALLPPAGLAAPIPIPASLRNGAEATALRERIDHEADSLAAGLSPDGRRAFQASIRRLHEYAGAHCGVHVGQKVLQDGEGTCLLNIEGNFLVTLPDSVYRVGAWHVFETGIYGIEWADGDLLEQDSDRPFWWDVEITWPRVDASPSPVPVPAAQALRAHLHRRMAEWATGGWSLAVRVRLVAINDCHVSATIETSTYAGGAHANEDSSAFNWNRVAQRGLQPADLFRTESDWQKGLIGAYRHHLEAGPAAALLAEVPDDSLAQSLEGGWVVTDSGLRFLEREGLSRVQRLPAADIPWSELSGWLVPGASCAAH